MTFKERILHNATFLKRLAERGYSFTNNDDDNHLHFLRSSNDIDEILTISIWDRVSFRASTLIYSKVLGMQYQDLGLYLDELPNSADAGVAVLSVDLLWLRWNEAPSMIDVYRNDYSYVADSGMQRFFEDMDTVGKDFLLKIATPLAMADFLMHIEKYPISTKLGGGPGSRDPFMFATILYLHCGQSEKARVAFDCGLSRLPNPDPDVVWKIRKYNNYRKRGELLSLF